MSNKIQHKAFITSFDDTTEGLVKAFVSVYGNVDSANEICDFGCFKDSLEYKYPVFCLYHNWEMPIGKVIVAEEIPAGDERLPNDLKEWGGLYIEAQINLDKEMGRDAWSDIKHGVLDEYSIGYVVEEDYVDKEGYRHLTKVDLIEASPVVRAANRMTKTIEVKSDQSIQTKEPYVPNEGMKEEAARALKWKEEGFEGGTRIGLTRANQIVNGENLSEETVKRMFSFFSRHEVDKQAEGFEPGEDGYPSPGRVAWGLWGGDAGYSWSKNIVEGLDTESAQENTQINTKQMNELLTRIQEMLAGVMSPLDELTAQMAADGILEEMQPMLDSVSIPAQEALGALDELRIALAEGGYLEEVTTDSYNEDEDEEGKAEEETEVSTDEETDEKALDLEAALGLLSEIIALSEQAMAYEMQWEDKSIDNITEVIIPLMMTVQNEIENPTGEVDLQAMLDAFAVVNTNVAELIAEAEMIDPEITPEITEYVATVRNIGEIATQLTEIVMAEMEGTTEQASQEEDSKAVESMPLAEQIELENLFNHYLQSQYNIN